MASTKGRALMWRFNNEKVIKIKQHLFEQDKMDEMLENFKKVLKQWQSDINPDIDEKMQVAFDMESVTKPPTRFFRKNTKLPEEVKEIAEKKKDPSDRSNSFRQKSFKKGNSILRSSENHGVSDDEEVVSYIKEDVVCLE
jgi:hypothetical protein